MSVLVATDAPYPEFDPTDPNAILASRDVGLFHTAQSGKNEHLYFLRIYLQGSKIWIRVLREGNPRVFETPPLEYRDGQACAWRWELGQFAWSTRHSMTVLRLYGQEIGWVVPTQIPMAYRQIERFRRHLEEPLPPPDSPGQRPATYGEVG